MNRWIRLLLVCCLTATLCVAQKGAPITDDRLHDLVLMKLAGDAEVKGGAIDVEVSHGMVTLKGKIEKEKQKDRAERLVKKIKGVTGVANQLVVTPK